MKKYLVLFVAVCWSAIASAAGIDTVAVFSEKMQREIPALVVTPRHEVGERLPVLYLLHGYSGNELTWQRFICDLRPLADRYRMIIVCPDGENSWYWDSPTDPHSQFETFVSRELTEWVDARYPTIPSREGRAITGFSMGGHGAMWIALHHKDLFGAAGTTSGGMDIRPFPDAWDMKDQLGDIAEYPERWDAYTVMTAADSLAPGELAIIMDCGFSDFFLDGNRRLHEKFLERKIDHDFLVRPGNHDNEYWSVSLPYQLLFFQRWFERQRPQNRIETAATGLRVVFIGDSITDGNWGREDGRPCAERSRTDLNHVYGSGYMYLCASHFQGYYPEREYRFFNCGISGDTLEGLAARWQQDVLDLHPDVLSVLIGTNDVNGFIDALNAAGKKLRPGFDLAAWEHTYRRLLTEAREANPGLRIVLCTPFCAECGWVKEVPNYPLRAELLASCARIVARLAEEFDATLVPFDGLIAELNGAGSADAEIRAGYSGRCSFGKHSAALPDTYWIWDGIHPTPACHRLMADCWIDAVCRNGVLE